LVLHAQLALSRLRILLAEVPDLMPERRLLRGKERNRDQQACSAPEHRYFAGTASVRR